MLEEIFNFFHPLPPTIALKDVTRFAEEERRHLTVTRLKAVQEIPLQVRPCDAQSKKRR